MPNWLYHLTPASRLPRIQVEGLRPGAPSTFRGGFYENYSRGRLFLAEAGGVPFWHARLSEHLEHQFDELLPHIPVLLRVPMNVATTLTDDDEGWVDSNAPSYFVTSSITPELIEWWDGRQWRPMLDFDAAGLSMLAAVEEWEDGDQHVTFLLPSGWARPSSVGVRRTVITPAALIERLHLHTPLDELEWPTPKNPSDVKQLLNRLAMKPAFLCGIVAVELALPHWEAGAPSSLTPAQRIAPDHALRLAKHWFRTPPLERWELFETSLWETVQDLQELTREGSGRREATAQAASFAALSALYLLRAIQCDLNWSRYGADYRAMLTVAIDSSIYADIWAAESLHPSDPSSSRLPRYGERWWRRCRTTLAFADVGEAEVSGPPRDLGPAEHIHADEGSTQIPNTWLPKPRTPIFAPQIEGFVYLGEHTFSCLNDEEGLKTFAVPVYRNIRFAQAVGVRLDAPIQDRSNAHILTADTEFVLLPLGHHASFLMGSPSSDEKSDEKPQHEVQFKHRFLIARTPATQRLWAKLADGLEIYPSYFGGNAERPVEGVRWNDCVRWCARTGLRLPSEAEWEFSCRAGTKTRYFFGNKPKRLSEFAWFDAEGGTNPVAALAANAFGLFDMLGNVWEWCADEWHDNYKGAPADGAVWAGADAYVRADAHLRVLRGGCWRNDASYCTSASRVRSGSWDRFSGFGFRPALTI